jgi:hypothetical protein
VRNEEEEFTVIARYCVAAGKKYKRQSAKIRGTAVVSNVILRFA